MFLESANKSIALLDNGKTKTPPMTSARAKTAKITVQPAKIPPNASGPFVKLELLTKVSLMEINALAKLVIARNLILAPLYRVLLNRAGTFRPNFSNQTKLGLEPDFGSKLVKDEQKETRELYMRNECLATKFTPVYN